MGRIETVGIRRHATGWLIMLAVGLIMTFPALQGCAGTPEAASGSEDFLLQGENGAMLRAAADGNMFKVDKLLNAGANVDAKTPEGATALMGAVYYGYPQTSRLLMERGADVNARTDRGVTALHYAAQQGHTAIVEELLRKGADPDPVSAEGNTPLALARAAGHQDVAELLRMAGATDASEQGSR
jgi:ankyrin repeat protein